MIIIDGGNAMFLNNDKKDARKPGDYFSEDLTSFWGFWTLFFQKFGLL